jgi:uncharacterized protein (DUF849 family)
MVRPVIISCAVTGGSVEATRINRHVPITPRQIADECIAAARAGANITHIHVREPDSGKATLEPKYFREVVQRIRDSGVDVLIKVIARLDVPVPVITFGRYFTGTIVSLALWLAADSLLLRMRQTP